MPRLTETELSVTGQAVRTVLGRRNYVTVNGLRAALRYLSGRERCALRRKACLKMIALLKTLGDDGVNALILRDESGRRH